MGSFKRVCHISTVHPLYDDRIFYKECKTLSEAGYEVYLIAVHTKDEKIQNINVKALQFAENRIKRIIWTSVIAFAKALSVKPDSVHIHDPEIIWMGMFLRLWGIKSLYDVHEDIEKQILYKDWLGWRWTRFVISKIVLILEQFFSIFFDKIIVVTEDIYKKFPASKTIILRNYPRLDLINSARPVKIEKKSKVIIYIGNLSKDRGILEIINAIDTLDVELWLIGKWEYDDYRLRCEKAEGWNRTRYFGSMKLEEVYKYLKCADAGVALLYPNKNYLTSLPVKAFEYMAAGIPMLLSDFPYWREVFVNCAEFVDPLNNRDIKDKLQLILSDSSLTKTMSENSIRMIDLGWSWETESIKLTSVYKLLFNEDK